MMPCVGPRPMASVEGLAEGECFWPAWRCRIGGNAWGLGTRIGVWLSGHHRRPPGEGHSVIDAG